MREGFRVDAGAGICDGKHHEIAGFRSGMGASPRFIEHDVGCGDYHLPAVGHRVARVDGQVHHHLLELPMIGLHAANRRVERDDDLDIFADEAR